jgi:hypothetical protein
MIDKTGIGLSGVLSQKKNELALPLAFLRYYVNDFRRKDKSEADHGPTFCL